MPPIKSIDSTTDSSGMLNKDNLQQLRLAIDGLCKEYEKPKCGLKVQLQNTIKQAAKIAEVRYLVEWSNDKAGNRKHFRENVCPSRGRNI